MLQLDNFPADGSIITGLPNGICTSWKKKKNEEDTQVFKFLTKVALLKSFQDWIQLCTIDLLGNLTTTKKLSKQSYLKNYLYKVNNLLLGWVSSPLRKCQPSFFSFLFPTHAIFFIWPGKSQVLYEKWNSTKIFYSILKLFLKR